MTNIDASLRRPILPDNLGDQVPDSKSLLSPVPQLIMPPGIPRPAFKFNDGDGLTDAFGNIYDGYGNGGGSVTFQNTPADSVNDELDAANDLDIIQFNNARKLYEPKSRAAAGLAEVGGTAPVDGQQLLYSTANSQYEPTTGVKVGGPPPVDLSLLQFSITNSQWEAKGHSDAQIAQVGGLAPTDGQMIRFVAANGRYEAANFTAPPPAAFTITDFISGIIEKPQNRIYNIIAALPYDIIKTGDSFSLSTGPGSITFPPDATILAGNTISISISATTAASEFLRFQINFTRVLAP